MKTLKNIGRVVLLQTAIIGLIFGILYLLKKAGISGGYARLLPFLAIMAVKVTMIGMVVGYCKMKLRHGKE